MIEEVVGAVQTCLSGANISRSFTVQVRLKITTTIGRLSDQTDIVQTLLPGAIEPLEKRGEASSAVRKPAPNYKVRMDPSNRTLDAMLAPPDPSQLVPYASTQLFATDEDRPRKRRGVDLDDAVEISDEEDVEVQEMERGTLWNPTRDEGKTKEIPESLCEFTSIKDLRQGARKKANAGGSHSFCETTLSDYV